jgi:hypothetical protein
MAIHDASAEQIADNVVNVNTPVTITLWHVTARGKPEYAGKLPGSGFPAENTSIFRLV